MCRVEYYRLQAALAAARAEQSPWEDVRRSWLTLARRWAALLRDAEDRERRLGPWLRHFPDSSTFH